MNTQRNKPWAKLRMSRREYEIKKPWKLQPNGVKMNRKTFEKALLGADQGQIDGKIDEGNAELMLNEIFRSIQP